MKYYDNVVELSDIKKIDKLNELKNWRTFHDDVRRLTKRVYSDHSIRRWACLSEIRYNELCREALICPWCGGRLKTYVHYLIDLKTEVCEDCYEKAHANHLDEMGFYKLLDSYAHNEYTTEGGNAND